MIDTCPANKLATWFAVKWDGSATDFDKDMAKAAAELYHPKLQIFTAAGIVDYDGMVISHRENIKRGLKCNIVKIEVLSDTKVEYKVRLIYKDGKSLTIHSIGEFKGGKLIRVDPFDKEIYDEVFIGAQ